MQRLSPEYSRFHNLRERTRKFLEVYSLLPPEKRQLQAALLLAQHCDAPTARELLKKLQDEIKRIYQAAQERGKGKGEKVEGEDREKIERLKREYIEELEKVSVWPGDYSNKILATLFPKDWERGWKIGGNLKWLEESIKHFHNWWNVDGYSSAKVVTDYLERIGIRDQSLLHLLAALYRDIKDVVSPDNFKLLLLEWVWEMIIKKIDDILKSPLTKFINPHIKITLTDPSRYYKSIMSKVAFLAAISSRLRKTALEILEEYYPDEEERTKAEIILRGILYLETQRISREDRVVIRKTLVEFLENRKIDEGIEYLRNLFREDPFILPIAGGLALGFELSEITKMQNEYYNRVAKMKEEERKARERKEEDYKRSIIEAALEKNARRWELKKWAESLKGTKWIDPKGRILIIKGVEVVESFMKADIFKENLPDDQRKSPGVSVEVHHPKTPKRKGHAYYCPLTIKEKIESGEWRQVSSSQK